MKNFALVLKTLMRNIVARRVDQNGKTRMSVFTVTFFAFVPLSLLLAVGMIFGYMINEPIRDVASFGTLMVALLSVAQFISVLFCMRGVLGVLFASNDLAFLNPLPIRATDIFFAKFVIAYIEVLAVSGTFYLPSALIVGGVFHYLAGGLTVGYYVGALLIAALSPLLPMLVITLIAIPVKYLGSLLKGRAVVKSVLEIVLYILLVGAYVGGVTALRMTDTGDGSSAMPLLDAVAKVMYPDKALVELTLGISPAPNAGIAVAFIVGALAIIVALAAIFYKKISVRLLESSSDTTKRKTSFKQNKLLPSLIKKDLLCIIRDPQMAMRHANILVAPVMLALMYFTSINSLSESPVLKEFMGLGFVMLYSLALLGAPNQFAAIAFTREGGSFYLSRSLPISAKTAIGEKLLIANVAGDGILIINCILAAAMYRVNMINVLLAFVTLAAQIFGVTSLSIYFDLKNGNVSWSNSDELNAVLQGNRGMIWLVIVVCVLGVTEFIMLILFAAFINAFPSKLVAYAIYWAVVAVSSAIFAAVGYYILKDKGEKLYYQIAERVLRIIPKRNKPLRKGIKGGLLNG